MALAVLALLGRRVPVELKIFLLSVAVADDIGAIIVIALCYSSGVALTWPARAAACLALIVAAQRAAIHHIGVYVALAAGLWSTLLESGVHATLAGVAVGLVTPAQPFHAPVRAAAAGAASARRVTGDSVTPLPARREERPSGPEETTRLESPQPVG